MDPSTEYKKHMSEKSASRTGYCIFRNSVIHNPVPKGVSKKEHARVLKGVKKNPDVDNPYALTNWITQQ